MASHIERFRVLWVDTDASGRIHYTATFRWVEATEMELHRNLGLIDGEWQNMPRKRVEATYELPLRFDDELEVALEVDRVGRTSVAFRWEVRREGRVAISGSHVTVRVDADGRPAPLTDEHRAQLLSLQARA